jgi:uncharacterized Zn-binding protein involved in type VI secretion
MVTGIVPHVGGPVIPPCHVTTLIAGLPAARVSDMATCVGPPDVITVGAPTTTIGGLPAARVGSQTAHGGVITLGCLTVLIGDSGSGSGGGGGAGGSGGGTGRGPVSSSAGTAQGMAVRAAKAAGKPFCEECARLAAARPRSDDAQSQAVRAAKQDGLPFCEECAKHAAS